MSATAMARRNAVSVVVDLVLQDLERSIGLFSNNLGEFPA
jgi:hypothetical protein